MAVNGVSNSYRNPDAENNLNVSTKSNSSLGLDDFLYLLAAQMANQDMMDPMKDTDFIAQLAQFSSLEAMQQLTQLNTTSYSTSLIGQEVTVAQLLPTGELVTTTGTVTGVSLYYDEPIFFIDGKSTAYKLSEIMSVGKMPEKELDKDDDGNGEGDGTGGAGGDE